MKRVISGKTPYAEVPSQLKEAVKNMLIREGYGHLVTE